MSFTVHNFTTNTHDAEPAHLVQLGQHVVQELEQEAGWENVLSVPEDLFAFQLNREHYNLPPPRFALPCSDEVLQLQDMEEDAAKLAELEDFDHCITSSYPPSEAQPSYSIPEPAQRPYEAPSAESVSEAVPEVNDMLSHLLGSYGSASYPNSQMVPLQPVLSVLEYEKSTPSFGDGSPAAGSGETRNHSAFIPPSAWFEQTSSSGSRKHANLSETSGFVAMTGSQEGGVSLSQGRIVRGSVGSEQDPLGPLRTSSPLLSQTNDPTPSLPLAQAVRMDLSLERTADSLENALSSPIPSWPAQNFTASLSPEFQLNLSADPCAPVQQLHGQTDVTRGSQNILCANSDELLTRPVSLSPLRQIAERPQSMSQPYVDEPSAYQAQPTSLLSQPLSFDPPSTIPSQPSAYRAEAPSKPQARSFSFPSSPIPGFQSPHSGTPSNELNDNLVHDNVSPRSHTGQVPEDVPGLSAFLLAGQHPSQERSASRPSSSSIESAHPQIIPSHPDTQTAPGLHNPQQRLVPPETPPSPIQDFTTILSVLPPLTPRAPEDRPIGRLAGPRWKLPNKPEKSSVKATQADPEPPLSPIEDFPSGEIPGLNFVSSGEKEADDARIDQESKAGHESNIENQIEHPLSHRPKCELSQDAAEEDDEWDETARLYENSDDMEIDELADDSSLVSVPSDIIIQPELIVPRPQQVERTPSDIALYGSGDNPSQSKAGGTCISLPSRPFGQDHSQTNPPFLSKEPSNVWAPPGLTAEPALSGPSAADRIRKEPDSGLNEREGGLARKRRRLERSICTLIPEPHVHTVPMPASPIPWYMVGEDSSSEYPERPASPSIPPPDSKAYTALNDLQILPSSPYTTDDLGDYLSDRYSRCAWIIPIRGSLPWPGSTSASVLDTDLHLDSSSLHLDDSLLPSGPTSNVVHQDSLGSITWTPDALRAMWHFLLSIREAKTMGDIGISFFTATPSSQRTTETGYGHQQRTSQSQAPTTAQSLKEVDYFKVYMPSRYAMSLRDILHIWRYECSSPAEQGSQLRRCRLLRGAKLVLVDEANRAVLIW